MPKYAVFNTVVRDGMGDFTHFMDIIKALKSNPKFSDVEFVPVVAFQERDNMNGATKVKDQLDALGYPYVLSTEDFSHPLPNVVEQLNDVAQVLVISSDHEGLVYNYTRYLPRNIPIKRIMEHEVEGMGLRDKCKGIKLKDAPKLSSSDAWDVIKLHNPEFLDQLLTTSEVDNIEAFQNQNKLVPAYFNKDFDFFTFLHRLSAIKSDFQDKNIAIYHSGSDLSSYDYEENANEIRLIFESSSVNAIQIIRKGEENPLLIEGNAKGEQIINVYSGFYLDDPAFEAIHQLSDISGVSGDNTLERCISMNILPFYWSTNPNGKKPTLEALCKITSNPELNLSKEAQASFTSFFHPYYYEQYAGLVKLAMRDQQRDAFPESWNNIDLSTLIKEWPKVCDYLKVHRNFYNELEGVVLANLPNEAKPAAFRTINITQQFKNSLASLQTETNQPKNDDGSLAPINVNPN